MKKAFFLDRDGILNEIVMREGVVSSPRNVSELRIVPQAIQLVEKMKRHSFLTVLITNQPDISRGNMTRNQLIQIHNKIRASIPLDHIEVCTSSDNSHFRRKPNPGMLIQSAKKWGIDLSQSYFLGDSSKDIEAGKRAAVPTILLQTSYNRSCHGTADYNCNSLEEISNLLGL